MIISKGSHNRIECLFRSFCLAFISARGKYDKRVAWKGAMKRVQKMYAITKEKAREWFKETLSIFERRENEKLKEKYGGYMFIFSPSLMGLQKPVSVH